MQARCGLCESTQDLATCQLCKSSRYPACGGLRSRLRVCACNLCAELRGPQGQRVNDVLFGSFCRRCREREDAAAKKEHTRRCEVIRSLPELSEALQKMMLDDYLLDDECLSMYRSQNWLGDENIEFYWEQIARELNSIGKALDILFVPPAVVMLAHFLTAQQLREPDNFGKNLGDISKMELVIMAINNAESTRL